MDTGKLTTPDYSYFIEEGNDFEIIEEPEEIDIQAIEQLEIRNLDYIRSDIYQVVKNNREAIHELIQAIKKLDNLLRPKQTNTDYRGMDKIAEEICREE